MIHELPAPAVLYSKPRASQELGVQFHSFDASYVTALCAGDPDTQTHFIGYFSDLLLLKLR